MQCDLFLNAWAEYMQCTCGIWVVILYMHCMFVLLYICDSYDVKCMWNVWYVTCSMYSACVGYIVFPVWVQYVQSMCVTCAVGEVCVTVCHMCAVVWSVVCV